MAVAIIDDLEIIQVDKGQRQGTLVALCPFEFPIQHRLHDPPIQQAREGVPNRHPLEPFVGNDVGETDGNLDGKLLKQLSVHARPVAQGRKIRLVQAADDFPLQADRRNGKGPDEVQLSFGEHGMKGMKVSVQKEGRNPVVGEPQESLAVNEVQSFLEVFGKRQALDEIGNLAPVDQGDPDTGDAELFPDLTQETLEQTLEVQDRKDAHFDLEELPGDLLVLSDSFQDATQLGKIPRIALLIPLCHHDLPTLMVRNRALRLISPGVALRWPVVMNALGFRPQFVSSLQICAAYSQKSLSRCQ